MGGGGQKYQQAPPTTTTQKSEPWEALQPFLKDALQRAQTAANQTTTTPFQGPQTAAVTDAQRQANQQRIDFANTGGTAAAGQGAIKLAQDTLAGAYLNPESNPYFKQGLQSTIRPMVENLQQKVLPQLTADAWNAGAYGGDRYNIEQGRRISETERNIADTSAKAYSDMYNQERQRQMQAPAMAQAGTSLSLMPSDIMSAAGAEQRGWSQEGINEEMNKYQQALAAPWQAVNPYAALLQGLPFGQSGTQATTGQPGIWTNQPSTGASMLSGAMGGASMGASFGLPGAIGGGILGLLGGLFK